MILCKHKISTHQKNEVPKSKHCGIKIAKPNHPSNFKKKNREQIFTTLSFYEIVTFILTLI